MSAHHRASMQVLVHALEILSHNVTMMKNMIQSGEINGSQDSINRIISQEEKNYKGCIGVPRHYDYTDVQVSRVLRWFQHTSASTLADLNQAGMFENDHIARRLRDIRRMQRRGRRCGKIRAQLLAAKHDVFAAYFDIGHNSGSIADHTITSDTN